MRGRTLDGYGPDRTTIHPTQLPGFMHANATGFMATKGATSAETVEAPLRTNSAQTSIDRAKDPE